jgi:DNA-binding transcriptional LysR family regulator
MHQLHHVQYHMQDIQLQHVDLNLLVALEALLTERSVTRAAARMELTPSAMSHALGRLRALFQDKLLVRTRGGMVTTPRADLLLGPLRRALLELAEIVRGGATFDPRTARRELTIAATDYLEVVLLPPLLERVSAAAPGVHLRVKQLQLADISGPLESGTFDVVLGVTFDDAPGLRQQTLFSEEMVCVCRQGHPEVGEQIDLETYLALRHVLVSYRGGTRSAVDKRLAEMGREREIALTVPHFLAAPLIVARSDLVLTAPRRIIEQLQEALSLRVLAPPVVVQGFTVRQVWHERYQDEPAHVWLRQQIFEAAGALRAPAAPRRRPRGKGTSSR